MTQQGLVLDTDIGGDVDDALALAYALRHPDIDLRAVTTVAGDTEVRAHIAARVLAIEGRDDVVVAAGVGGFKDRAWTGHEGQGLEPGPEVAIDERSAIDVLLASSEVANPPVVATVGLQSNLAAVVERDPTYPARVPQLAVMGGVFAPINFYGRSLAPSRDFNLVTDSDASATSLNAGFEIRYVPLNVTFTTTLRDEHLRRLRAGDALCRALATLCDVWRVALHARSPGLIPEPVVSFLHDPLTVAAVVEESFVTIERLPVTVAVHHGIARTFIDPLEGREADVVTGVNAEAFVEHWCDVVIG